LKKTMFFTMIAILLTSLFVLGCTPGDGSNDDELDQDDVSQLMGKILILQAYGSSADAAGISHSFVELYNVTNTAIDLSGLSIYYADGTNQPNVTTDGQWKRISLDGKSIPAKCSFLILGQKQSATAARYQIPDDYYDINDSSFTLSNRAFKVALIEGNAELTVQNPFNTDGAGTKVAGYIDMVGAANTYPAEDSINGYEISPARNSGSVAVRRKNLNDTDDNGTDFASLDYRPWSTGNPDRMTDEQLERYKPRNAEYGAWNPLTGEKTDLAIENVTINGNGVKNGALNINVAGQVTLSAGIVPSDADLTGVTYAWSVSDESPSGVITLPSSVNSATILITAAEEGTAKVNLNVKGPGIGPDGITGTIDVTVVQGTASLMILQIGAATDGNIQRSFVELYNNTNLTITLDDAYSLQYATGTKVAANETEDGEWKKINLSGTILPYSSYLILGPQKTTAGGDSPAALQFDNNDSADFYLETFELSNRAVKVVVMNNQTLLTVQNPFNTDGSGTKAAGYIDMIGIINDATDKILGSEGETTYISNVYRISKQVGLRRISLVDTDDNSVDFIAITYSQLVTKLGGVITAYSNEYEIKRPKNQLFGAWNPITGEKIN